MNERVGMKFEKSDEITKPCPFCGYMHSVVFVTETHVVYNSDIIWEQYYVYCRECGGRIGATAAKKAAIRNWNNRVAV